MNTPEIIFWDFDGVIKDSVNVKTQAFITLFQPFGDRIANRVREHHETHGGMSRFDKMPLYLQWAGKECNQSLVSQYCDQFACLVVDAVINSPWVPGAEAYLRANPNRQRFIVVSATPQEELELILYKLKLIDCFAEIIGAPTCKKDAIRMTLKKFKLDPQNCLLIGDAKEDYTAAQVNNVPFLLRMHGTNSKVFEDYSGPSVKDFTAL